MYINGNMTVNPLTSRTGNFLIHHMVVHLENIVCLRQRQLGRRLGVAQHTVCFDSLSHDVSDVYSF